MIGYIHEHLPGPKPLIKFTESICLSSAKTMKNESLPGLLQIPSDYRSGMLALHFTDILGQINLLRS